MNRSVRQNEERCALPSYRQSMKSNFLCLCAVIKKKEHKSGSKVGSFNVPSYRTDEYGNVYYCVHCNVAYYDCRSVKDHLGTVHKDLHYFCEYCGEFFAILWQLKRHQNMFSYNCDHCDYSSNHYAQFREHSSRAHKIELQPKFRSENRFSKVYECDICGYQVLRPHMYKKHMKSVHDTEWIQ